MQTWHLKSWTGRSSLFALHLRFPADFMFELTKEENQSLWSQNVTLKRGQLSKYLPFAFSEQGVNGNFLDSDRVEVKQSSRLFDG